MILPKESATFFKLPIQLFKGVSYPELALYGNPIENKDVVTNNASSG